MPGGAGGRDVMSENHQSVGARWRILEPCTPTPIGAFARAVQSKDARFDRWFFTAVLTTQIHCHPNCPALTPKVQNMTLRSSPTSAWSSRPRPAGGRQRRERYGGPPVGFRTRPR